MFASLQNPRPSELVWQTAKFQMLPSLLAFTAALASVRLKVNKYAGTDRQSTLTDLAQNFIRTYILDDDCVPNLSIWHFQVSGNSRVRTTSNIQTDRLPLWILSDVPMKPTKFCVRIHLPQTHSDHIPNFIPVALIVFELSCSQTDRHNSKIVFFGLRDV
ncbi:hypothetical protein AVEN_252235-1 [Araneus ventricosus]|uniref:Uncharacterized protein n=1 Tax=Araneus ventricosus TaxID=182803 RepID=A0A4Y2TDN5_ARAVE|nr:hypothetical protein AVEN_252235-1 [Araneus ventricosus]